MLRHLFDKLDKDILYDCVYEAMLAFYRKGLHRTIASSAVHDELTSLRQLGNKDGRIRGTFLENELLNPDESKEGFRTWFVLYAKTYCNGNPDVNEEQKEIWNDIVRELEGGTGPRAPKECDFVDYWCKDTTDYVKIYISNANQLVKQYLNQFGSDISLIVLDNDEQVVGIITSNDLRKIMNNLKISIQDAMSKPVETFSLGTKMQQILDRFNDQSHPIGHAPIVNENKRFVGMVTMKEVILWEDQC